MRVAYHLDVEGVPALAPAAVAAIRDETTLVNCLVAGELATARPYFDAVGLEPSPANAERLGGFYQGLAVRLALQALHDRVLIATHAPDVGTLGDGRVAAAANDRITRLMPDAALAQSLAAHGALLDVLVGLYDEPSLAGLIAPFQAALTSPGEADSFLEMLKRSQVRADAIIELRRRLELSGLFDAQWIDAADQDLRDNLPALDTLESLHKQFDTFEDVIRVNESLASLPDVLRHAAQEVLEQSAAADEGTALLRHALLAVEISRRLAAEPALLGIDGHRVRANFDRYRRLEREKQGLVRDAIRTHWVGLQKLRLLANTGTRLNAAGADLRRRLTLRGERAMRLRKVIYVGAGAAGGDPLFDLCPIWMVSPETVAQVFPRKPIFDVVVFDEASQCRLEEALPVITRGGRVVIAGDPRQLPPTRFFESAVSHSDDEDAETDQELFESQQGEIEDLLAAALGLDIQQCYLDVHYRSRSAELIAFSNEHFYGSRLQPVPSRPVRRAAPGAAGAAAGMLPVRLYRVAGTYEKRSNRVEAERVCQIVRDLLDSKEPPSIGVACFNLPQRNLIIDMLDEMAAEDAVFSRRLEAARRRTGRAHSKGCSSRTWRTCRGMSATMSSSARPTGRMRPAASTDASAPSAAPVAAAA